MRRLAPALQAVLVRHQRLDALLLDHQLTLQLAHLLLEVAIFLQGSLVSVIQISNQGNPISKSFDLYSNTSRENLARIFVCRMEFM